jgi:transcriptional regulator with XRE-family HTH domain
VHDVEGIVGSLGFKVRSLRKRAGLSLQQLGARADVSAAAIHKIEQGGMTPTITTLLKVANALGRPASYFVEGETGGDELAVRTPAGEERPVYTAHEGITLHSISGPYGRFFLAGARARVCPGASSGGRPMEHPGEELIYVTAGTLEFVVNGRTYRLETGDALHLRGDQPHTWCNPTERDAEAAWIALRTG